MDAFRYLACVNTCRQKFFVSKSARMLLIRTPLCVDVHLYADAYAYRQILVCVYMMYVYM